MNMKCGQIIRSFCVLSLSLIISGCIDGPKMLAQSDRVPAFEDGKWCKLDAKEPSLVSDCYVFEWRENYYQAGDSLYGFREVGDGKFIGEYADLDEETNEPNSTFWPKFVVQVEDRDSKMANIGYDEDHFENFERRATYYADARGATLSLDIDDDFGDTWYLQGPPYAIRRVMTDLLDHLNPQNERYFKLVDDGASPDSYPMQIADIARGTAHEIYVGEYICFSGVQQAKNEQATAEEIASIKKIFDACEALRALGPREYKALGGLYWTEGSIPNADAHYRKAIEHKDPFEEIESRYEALYHWGWMHFSNGNYEEVIAIFSQLLEENPEHLIARNTRGISYRLLNDHPKALADYTKTIELAKQLNDTWQLALAMMRRGYVHQDDGRLDIAEKDVQAALALVPELSYGYSTLGIIAEKRGNPSKARQHFERALELDSANVHAQEGMARVN